MPETSSSDIPDRVMEDNDKENLLMAEADEDNESQAEEVNEEKRDDKVSEDVVDGDGLEPV